jgi:hypothetical protein
MRLVVPSLTTPVLAPGLGLRFQAQGDAAAGWPWRSVNSKEFDIRGYNAAQGLHRGRGRGGPLGGET